MLFRQFCQIIYNPKDLVIYFPALTSLFCDHGVVLDPMRKYSHDCLMHKDHAFYRRLFLLAVHVRTLKPRVQRYEKAWIYRGFGRFLLKNK